MKNWKRFIRNSAQRGVIGESKSSSESRKDLLNVEEKLDKVMREYDRLAELYPGSDPDDWLEFKAIENDPGLNITEAEISYQYKIAKEKQSSGEVDPWRWFHSLHAPKGRNKKHFVANTVTEMIMFGIVIPIMVAHNIVIEKDSKKAFELIKKEFKKLKR